MRIFLLFFVLTSLNLTVPAYSVNHINDLIKAEKETIDDNLPQIEILSSTAWASNSILSDGYWVKVKTDKKGIFKITYDQLENWGFTSPSQVKLYGNGGYMLSKMNDNSFYDDLVQNSIWHGKDSQNQDCIFFFSTGTIKWEPNDSGTQFTHEQNDYSDYAYYYLTDYGSIKNIETRDEELTTFSNDISTYTDYLLYEDEKVNVLESGRIWFGDKFSNGTTRTYDFSISNLDDESPVHLNIQGIGRSESSSRFRIYIDDIETDILYFQSVTPSKTTTLYASSGETEFDKSNMAENFEVSLKYVATNSNSNAWLDFIEINAKRNLVLNDSQIVFRDLENVGGGNSTKFNLTSTASNIQVWDITDYTTPLSISFTKNENLVQFIASTDSLREFIAFDPKGEIPEPSFVENIDNQDLHGSTAPEMIIISHPDFIESANELANFHEQYDDLTVNVVSTEAIYNEFSCGIPDITGIRNYLKMCYDRTNSGDGELKYVLLWGDGSYDNKNILGAGLNFIPTYQSENSLLPTSSFVSDDFFVLLDDGEGEYEGFIDLGIGRIPVKTTDEAEIIIDKIKNYTSSDALGSWRNVICFIGDDEDGSTHMEQAEMLADDVNELNPSFFTDKIYLDAYTEETTPSGDTYPDVNSAINNRVKNGTLILNYTGHANQTTLADEKILTTNDIDSWTNYNKLPIFITATCEFSRFDADDDSGGEHILFNASGGGIGLFSTTRVVYSSQNYILNKEIYEHIFSQDEDGKNLRMGDVLKLTKNGIDTGINKRNFTLLADPALSLSFPKYQVITETINGISIEEQTDTIKALSTVIVSGRITDYLGNTLTDFDGEIIPVVYDKQDTVRTMGNNGESPYQYKVQSNVIYQGVAEVTSGEFEFTFIVPKDISYAYGKGKITYYANDGEIDASGYTSDFILGGYSGNTINDIEGPEINAYINNASFNSGDEVGSSSLLFIELNDETGINTVGTGIGHDITALITNNDDSDEIVLNDYYLSDLNSYQSGSVIYPLSDLTPGNYEITIKAWDVLNNSSEITISFVVTDNLIIEDVICYPNPITDYTNFKFTHNRADESFDAEIEIYDFSGNLIDSFSKSINSDGNESEPIVWQVSDSQALIRSGAYLYRIIIEANDGYSASKTGKMIILKY